MIGILVILESYVFKNSRLGIKLVNNHDAPPPSNCLNEAAMALMGFSSAEADGEPEMRSWRLFENSFAISWGPFESLSSFPWIPVVDSKNILSNRRIGIRDAQNRD
jgi:hypothetical protein